MSVNNNSGIGGPGGIGKSGGISGTTKIDPLNALTSLGNGPATYSPSSNLVRAIDGAVTT